MSDDVDDEFARLTADLAKDSDLSTDPVSDHDGERTSVGLVLAPVDNAAALSAFIKLAGLDIPVVKTTPWAAAWMELKPDAMTPEEEELALLTGEPPIPTQVDEVARVVSKLTPYGAVAIVSWLADDDGLEIGVSGTVIARRYVAGEPEERIEAGLLMNQLDNVAEDLILGRTTPEDYPDQSGGWKQFFRRPGRHG